MRRAPKARRICRKASAFSLVELLVVVAIMGLLLSLLLPALSRAKAVAQTVVCLSQIRQINIGSHSYAAEHKGAFQGGHVHVALGPTMYYAWPGSYRAYLDDQRSSASLTRSPARYIRVMSARFRVGTGLSPPHATMRRRISSFGQDLGWEASAAAVAAGRRWGFHGRESRGRW